MERKEAKRSKRRERGRMRKRKRKQRWRERKKKEEEERKTAGVERRPGSVGSTRIPRIVMSSQPQCYIHFSVANLVPKSSATVTASASPR